MTLQFHFMRLKVLIQTVTWHYLALWLRGVLVIREELHSRGMNLDLEKVMMTKTDPHPAAFATQRKNGRSLDSHAAQTAKAAYIFYNTEHSVPGQYSHFSWLLLSIPGSCRFLFSVIASSTDFRTNSTKFRVFFWFFGYSQNFHQAFGPLRHLPSDNRTGASPGASLIFSTWSRRRSGHWGCFSSASSTLWRPRSGDVQKPHELLRNSEEDLRRSRWCDTVWISVKCVAKKNEFRCNGC